MKSKRTIIYFIFIIVPCIVLGFFCLIKNSAWYHWREVNKFRNNPIAYSKSSGMEDGEKILSHMTQLVKLKELEYKEFSDKKAIDSEEIRRTIKKYFPDIIWIQVLPWKENIAIGKRENFTVKVWAVPCQMHRFEKFWESNKGDLLENAPED